MGFPHNGGKTLLECTFSSRRQWSARITSPQRAITSDYGKPRDRRISQLAEANSRKAWLQDWEINRGKNEKTRAACQDDKTFLEAALAQWILARSRAVSLWPFLARNRQIFG